MKNIPLLDWSIKENRDKFSKALEEIEQKFPYDFNADKGNLMFSMNPNYPKEIIGITSAMGSKDLNRTIALAKKASQEWKNNLDRSDYLRRAADILKRYRYEAAALEVFEVGKSWTEADGDVCEAIDFLVYYAEMMDKFPLVSRVAHIPGETSFLHHEPRGVVSVIAPWNFPIGISMGMIAAALVTGNTVVYKPSSLSFVCGYYISKIFEEAGLPHGVFNLLVGKGSDLGNGLVYHPDIDMIAFTGSKDVGLRLTRKAGQLMKKAIVETGGKNAIIIDADADLDEAITHVIRSSFGYQGQKCSACSRLIVLEEIYDRLIERLKTAAESIVLGPTENPENFMGAVISEEAAEKINDLITKAKSDGAKVIVERFIGGEGYFVPLTILVDVGPYDTIAHKEVFGPVLSVIKVKTFEEALQVANCTEYALTGGVFSRSPKNIDRASEEFRVGNLYINRGCTGAVVGRHPFGGFKMSGTGPKAGGPDYLAHFMITRNIVENTLRRGFAPE